MSRVLKVAAVVGYLFAAITALAFTGWVHESIASFEEVIRTEYEAQH